ncbi:bifunctional diguanylate cyclase/phosphodiesterase [Pseudomonas sp. NCCP-436]|uniref:putative bifunctional diguanylate cyclase/phosphodiesterase n=1 Tax=Pseudomonas sp. NCCP-436 TaxID=2842481 RepID=UPI001C812634|nr:EAL domain-containing protein [Pseudomonas sp. NCCP-436]
MLIGSYDLPLVVLSLCVAILSAYTALDLAGRIASAKGSSRGVWIGGGAVAMGFGIWSMHFVGMLAFSLPIPLGYDLALTLLSLAIAILASGFALWLVSQPVLPLWHIGLGSLAMGAGIGSMHYIGMAAMRMQPGIDYDPLLFVLSLLIAVLASGAALLVAFRLRRHMPHVRLARAGAAVIMGLAIVGMHYTGMAAANFPAGSFCGAALSGLDSRWLASLVIVTTLAVLAITLLTSVLDARLQARTELLNSSLARANAELTQLALHDGLTKLPNRLLLEDRIAQGILKVQRHGGHLALLYMDLDGFKPINDAFGHHVGDRLLVAVAQRLRSHLRAQDSLARIGGDEFVLLVELRQRDDAAKIASHVLGLLTQAFEVDGHRLRVSASVGIALYPGDAEDQKTLLINADAAMYHAKRLGKNDYSFFERSMNADARQQLELLQDLRMALERQEFCLYYQAKFASDGGRMLGAEALLRWQHPHRGLLSPAQFMELAERTGLIVPIGNWVLDEACRQMRQWYEQGHTDWSVAVNLSALQFGNAGLLENVRQSLTRHCLPASCLTLEITESTAMQDVIVSQSILEKLTDMGVGIAIDDFGTGYSSLLYLKRLPADELKIDRGFVNDLQGNGEDVAIVSAIVALGQALNLRIVAEGVETPEQQEFLTRLGCDSLQGFWLGQPLPPERLFSTAG